MSTTPAASPTPEATRTVAIDFLYMDVSTDTEVQVRRTQVRSAEQARELQFEISPTIRVNGRDIALEQRQSPCGPDGCACGMPYEMPDDLARTLAGGGCCS